MKIHVKILSGRAQNLSSMNKNRTDGGFESCVRVAFFGIGSFLGLKEQMQRGGANKNS